MDKFTKLKSKSNITSDDKDNVLFSSEYVKIVSFEDWDIIKSSDSVICIPYLIESNQIILRHEYVPTFKYVDGQEYHMTIVAGSIENGETPQMALLRELEEEAGIVLSPNFKFEFMKPFYVSKGCSSKYHPCIMSLSERDYHEIVPTTDGTRAEKLSRPVKVDAKYISAVNASDLASDYMLIKMKEYLNL